MNGDATDAGGTAGVGGNDGDGENEYEPYVTPTSEDELTLLACEAEQVCGDGSNSQQIENDRSATVESSRCVLEALAQGRPGRYVHLTEQVFGNGSYGAKHTVIVKADGAALYARVPYGGVSLDERFDALDEAPDPGQRCTLKPQSYFEECVTAVTEDVPGEPDRAAPGSLAYECAFGDGDRQVTSRLLWFESCESESPIACE